MHEVRARAVAGWVGSEQVTSNSAGIEGRELGDFGSEGQHPGPRVARPPLPRAYETEHQAQVDRAVRRWTRRRRFCRLCIPPLPRLL